MAIEPAHDCSATTIRRPEKSTRSQSSWRPSGRHPRRMKSRILRAGDGVFLSRTWRSCGASMTRSRGATMPRSLRCMRPIYRWITGKAGAPDAQAVYHGHEGVRTMFRNWLAPFRSFEFRAEAFQDAWGHVLVRVSEHGIGRTSGGVVDRCHGRSGPCKAGRS